MRLEDVSAVIRPRGQWEAIDLGFAMVRRHFAKIIAAWSLTVVPLWLGLLALSWYIPLGWSLLAIWWLKPVYDRVPLFILSRSLFGATPTLGVVLREWPKMMVSRIIWILVFRFPWLVVIPHFSWSRSLTQTVIDLEQQRGKALKDRQQVLLRLASGRTGWLAMVCGLYEMLMVFALLTLGVMMSDDPTGLSGLGEAFIDMAFREGEMVGWLKWSLIAGYLFSMTFVELFFVGGGFGLYLNCRTQLEGWDIEITFRRLAKRLQKAVVAIFFCAFASSASAIDIEKKSSIEKSAIDEVLKHKDFEVVKVKREVSDEDSERQDMSLNADWLAAVGNILYYTVIVALVAWLCWLLYVNRHLFQRAARGPVVEKKGVRTIMGMDVTPESLPADIVAAARACWSNGDARGALSLLYRGSLSWLVHHDKLPVREGDTEGDCLRYTRRASEPAKRDYFAELTGQWVLVAYAERPPNAGEMERLFQSWPFRAEGGAA
jgi:hypothetical protein